MHNKLNQLTLDAAVGLIGAMLFVSFWLEVPEYLRALKNPLPLEVLLWSSLGSAIFREFWVTRNRFAIHSALATILIFVLGIPIAEVIRDWYLVTVETVQHVQELTGILAKLGPDVLDMMRNRTVGHGSSFGVAAMALRLTAYPAILKAITRFFTKSENRPHTCALCNQHVHR